jgi:diguanylate cyclase (GGDEF)-like protein/PAS domain S-box-containing protein
VKFLTWRKVAIAGLAATALAAPFGETAQILMLVAAVLGEVICVTVGVRRWKPAHKRPWVSFIVAGSMFLISFGLRIAGVNIKDGVEVYPSIPDIFDALGYFATIMGVYYVARLRDHRKDPTNVLDTLAFAGGLAVVLWAWYLIPHVLNNDIPLATRAADFGFSVEALVLFTAVARLAIGPGVKNASYYLIASMSVFALFADLLTSLLQSGITFTGAGSLSILLPTASFVALSAAALHPSMVEITQPVRVEVGQMTRRRLISMTAAVLVPPIVLITQSTVRRGFSYFDVLVGCSVAVTALLIVRFAGLVRARETVANVEHAMGVAAAQLVATTDRGDMYKVALTAVMDFAEGSGDVARASVISRNDDGSWSVTATSGFHAHLANDFEVSPSNVELLANLPTGATILNDVREIDVLAHGNTCCIVAAPLTWNQTVSGTLLLTTADAPSSTVIDAVASLATILSLALQTALLTEDLHRRRSDKRFRSLIENSGDLLLVLDHANAPTFKSPTAERLLDSKSSKSWLDFICDEDRSVVANLIVNTRLDPNYSERIEFRSTADGSTRWFEATAKNMDHEPEIEGVVFSAREVTLRKQAERERDQSQARFAALLQHSSDMTIALDDDGRVTYASPSCEKILGIPLDTLTGEELQLFVHHEDQTAMRRLIAALGSDTDSQRTMQLELRISTGIGTGRWKTLDVTFTDLRSEPAVRSLVLNAHDVSERKKLENDLRHRVLHDDLTGIANRVLFRERVHHAAVSRTEDSMAAVLFIDIDDFKTVNDGLGHNAGDELLKILAFRLHSFVRASDTAARLGGDEFAVLLERVEDLPKVLDVAERLLETIEQPVQFEDRTISVSASIGIALANDDTDADALLRNADVAMYSSKRNGKGRVRLFDESMWTSTIERLELKADLALALERDEFEVYYQPIVYLPDAEIAGFEALMRWNHSSRGWVSPVSFIPIAEETGQILEIGEWVLTTAMRQLAEWDRMNPGNQCKMSINVSPHQLKDDTIVDLVRDMLAETGIPASRIVLELTESAVLQDGPSRARLEALGDLGVGIAADDFGSGFASYAALQQLPFTTVKIDRSLLLGLTTSVGRAEAQLRSIIDMAHETGLSVVAEGIEDSAQRDTLSSMGCDRAQGFLFGRPMPASDAAELVRTSSLNAPH